MIGLSGCFEIVLRLAGGTSLAWLFSNSGGRCPGEAGGVESPPGMLILATAPNTCRYTGIDMPQVLWC